MIEILGKITPFFAIVLFGYLAKRQNIIGTTGLKILNRLVLYVFLPAVLLVKLASTPITDLLNVAFLLAYLLAAFSLILIGGGIGYFIFDRKLSNAFFIGLSGVYGNIGFLGIPLLASVIGPWTSVPLAIILTIDLVVLIPLITLILQLCEAKQHDGNFTSLMAIKRAFLNPLIISIAIGLSFSFFNISLSSAINNGLSLIGKAAGPAAMFIVGASLFGKSISRKPYEAIYMSSLKLIIYPIFLWIFMHFFKIDGNWAIAAILAAAMPCAAVLSVIAEEYETMPLQASTAVLLTTLLSSLTLPYLIGVLI